MNYFGIYINSGGDFKPYLSLEDAVSNGVTWKARCILAAPKRRLLSGTETESCVHKMS